VGGPCQTEWHERQRADRCDPRLDAWLDSAQPLTGPARLALMGYETPLPDPEPTIWPLARDPAEDEVYPIVVDPPLLDESSGVLVSDAGELTSLRETRTAYLALHPGADYTPMLSSRNSDVGFHMLLRDELPLPVQEALHTLGLR
jgi:hypothetical protein